MNRFQLAGISLSIVILAGCATAPQPQASCADASSTDPACVNPPARVNAAEQAAQQARVEADAKARFDVLQQALDAQVKDAQTAIDAAAAATQSLPKAQRARNASVQTRTMAVTDSQTPRVAELTVLDSVRIELPVAGKRKRPYVNAMDGVKSLAMRIADQRGGATILVEQNPSDVRGRKVNTAEGESLTKDGNAMTVQKSTDATLPRGVERYTIQAGELTKRP